MYDKFRQKPYDRKSSQNVFMSYLRYNFTLMVVKTWNMEGRQIIDRKKAIEM